MFLAEIVNNLVLATVSGLNIPFLKILDLLGELPKVAQYVVFIG